MVSELLYSYPSFSINFDGFFFLPLPSINNPTTYYLHQLQSHYLFMSGTSLDVWMSLFVAPQIDTTKDGTTTPPPTQHFCTGPCKVSSFWEPLIRPYFLMWHIMLHSYSDSKARQIYLLQTIIINLIGEKAINIEFDVMWHKIKNRINVLFIAFVLHIICGIDHLRLS